MSDPNDMTKTFLVVVRLWARRRLGIHSRWITGGVTGEFPELEIVEATPAWMDHEYLRGLAERTQDIGGPYSGFLASLIANREDRTDADDPMTLVSA